MKMKLFLLLLYFVNVSGSEYFSLSIDPKATFTTWKAQSIKRDDLLCPQDNCRSSQNTYRTRIYTYGELYCCACLAKTKWEISGVGRNLSIEYIQSDGSAVIINDDDDNITVSFIVHRNGHLTRLPLNICQISTLVKVDLSHNFISDISLLHCVTNLDTLDLSHNTISSLKQSDLSGLTKLRIIDLSYCGLKTVEPFTLTGPSLHILHMDLSHNYLESFDISNIVTDKIFCMLKLRNNGMKSFTNKGNFTIDPAKFYEGGHVDVNLNEFSKFVDLRNVLRIKDLRLVGKIMNIALKIGVLENRWPCDCNVIQLLDTLGPTMSAPWAIDDDAKCRSPKTVIGESIFKLFRQKDRRLEYFRCYNLTLCPDICTCYYQPFPDNRTIINCNGTYLTNLPSIIPPNTGLVLNYSNNSIGAFNAKPYLLRAVIVDLSMNKLVDLGADAVAQLDVNVILNISGNNIQRLPREIQNLDPCNIISDTIIINCGCTEIWLIDWLSNKDLSKCEVENAIFCSFNGIIKSVMTLSKQDLCNETDGTLGYIYLMGIMGLTLILSAMVVYIFRIELYLIKRTLWKGTSGSKIRGKYIYDVFISFDKENNQIRKWVLKILDTNLRSMGYRTFIPCRDLSFGSGIEEEILQNIKCCRHHIVILSCMYGYEQNSQVEWRYIWSDFKTSVGKEVLVINFDHVDAFDCLNRNLQAYLRIGLFIDFTNKSKKFFTRISEIIGPPTFARKDDMSNMRSKFQSYKLKTFKNFTVEMSIM